VAAVDAAGNLEPALAWEYTQDGEPPQTLVSFESGAYRPPLTVALACSDAASGCARTHYTLDGSAPGPASPRYEAPITVLTTATLRFASVDAVGNAEAPGEAVYVIDDVAPTATATPPGGSYGDSLTVSLSCDDGAGSGCAGIRYTLDPSLGEAFWPLYEEPIAVGQSGTLRFAAIDAAGNVAAASETYTIDTIAPRLVSSAPQAGAGAVEPDAVPDLTFDEALVVEGLAATVNGVAASVALDLAGRTVTVTPAGPLALDSAVTVALSGVRDAFGNAPAQPVELSFRTRGDVLPLSADGSATLTFHDLAYDATGNAVAVFEANTGKVRKTMATRFDAASGSWGPEVELHRETVALHSVARPVAVASNGSGFLVAWSTAAPTAKARFIDGTGVVGPELALFGTAHLQGVASNGSGYVVAVMTPTGMAARAWDGSLWSLEEHVAPQGYGFRLLGNGAGYFGGFRTTDAGVGYIWTVSSADGVTWSSGVVFSASPAPSLPAVAAGANGVRAVAFTTSGAVGGVFASFGAGGALPAPVMIANGNEPVNASVAISTGSVAVAWQALVEGGVATSARIHASGAWGAEETLASGAGTPGGTRLASDGAGYLALASSGATGQVVRAYQAGSWGSALAPVPAGAQAGAPLLLAGEPGGYVLVFARDDGASHRLSTRAHTGAATDEALGATVDVPAAQQGSARELRLAADGYGGSAAVWTQEHRGGPAVFAAVGRNGAFDPPFLVALGADSPAVASNGAGFVAVYRRGAACESVRLDGEAAPAPVRLDDGSGTCSMPAIASDGASYVAGWRARVGWMYRIEAAVGDGETWGPGVTLHSDGYFDTELDVAAHAGTFAAAYDLGGSVLFSSSDDAGATFGAPREVDPFGPDDGPRLAAGPAGFGLLWTNYTNVYGIVAAAGVFPWAPTMVAQIPEHCGSPAIAAGTVGFLSAFDCASPYVAEWANGWKPALRLSTVAAGGIRLASSPRGYAIVYGERSADANLRGGTRVDGAWELATLRPKVEADPALAWDGEAHVVGWREADMLDAGVDRVLVRRGL
jgi:hypothetical protein